MKDFTAPLPTPASPSALPPGWATTTLANVTTQAVAQTGPGDGDEFLYVDISSVDNAAKRIVEPKTLPTSQAPSRARQSLVPGDVLVSMTRPNLNAVAQVSDTMTDAVGSTGFHVLRAIAVESKFLYYLVQTQAFVEAMSALVQGALYPAVRPRDINGFGFALPPLPEQRRIVAEIERQFSLLDAGVANLRRVQANLRRYRASVLQDACAGRLVPTEAELARAEGREYEPADRLLARILAERRERWEADQLAKMEARGTLPMGGAWKAKYQDPSEPDTAGLPESPAGWTWTTLGQVAHASGYGTSEKCDYTGKGHPVLRIPNIARGSLDLRDLKNSLSPISLGEGEALDLGDLLVVRTNGSKSLIGRGAVVRQPFVSAFYFASYLIRFRLMQVATLPDFISAIWHSPYIRNWVESTAATSAGQYNISMSALNGLPLPLPPQAEQERIVAEVERRLSVVDELEKVVAANLKRADRLRQAILKDAFAGRLVPQDPADEPASALLERLRAERAATQDSQRTPRKTGAAGARAPRTPKPDAAGNGHQAALDLVL